MIAMRLFLPITVCVGLVAACYPAFASLFRLAVLRLLVGRCLHG
jgi:hypothetical protein